MNIKSLINFYSKERCRKAIRNGGIAALITTSLSFIVGIISFFVNDYDDKVLSYMMDPLMLIDSVLVLILAIFIFRKSKVATTLMFIYFTCSKLDMWYTTGSLSGLPLALVFLFFYFNAMVATFVWHSKYEKQDKLS